MARLKVNVKETFERWTPNVGQWYRIHSAVLKVTKTDSLPYVQLTLVGADHRSGQLTLWVNNDVVRPTSLTGSFVSILGQETDLWADKYMRFTSYGRSANKIEVSDVKPEEKKEKTTAA